MSRRAGRPLKSPGGDYRTAVALPFRPLPPGSCLYEASFFAPSPQLSNDDGSPRSWSPTPTVMIASSGPSLGNKRRAKGPAGAGLVRNHWSHWSPGGAGLRGVPKEGEGIGFGTWSLRDDGPPLCLSIHRRAKSLLTLRWLHAGVAEKPSRRLRNPTFIRFILHPLPLPFPS